MQIQVDLDPHHLEELTARPATGLVELIWNALDADANRVEISFGRNDLGGIEEIRVQDDGHGMTQDEARVAFATLGGSWKLHETRTRSNLRALHGKHGRGRFRAAGIGQGVRWETVAEDGDRRYRTVIEVRGDRLRQVDISDPVETDEPTGTKVVVHGIPEPPEGINEATADRLIAQLAIYISQYHPTIVYAGTQLDPASIQLDTTTYEIEAEDRPQLDVIEWARPFDRALYLCNPEGMALNQIVPGIQAPGFNFTAYLRWTGFEDERRALTAELDPEAGQIVEEARDLLRHHFRGRADEEKRTQIEAWKAENVYPYEADPEDEAEEATRELFDVVAVTARTAVNAAEAQGRRFSLELLRQAVEQDPGSLRRVLQEVLDLPEEQLEELDELLSQTSLTQVITASRSITNRLDFLKALDEMVHDPELKNRVLERRQLHRILVNELWVFGEAYALGVDDQALRAVLERHIELLGRDELTPAELAEPMAKAGERKQAIVDLMLYRSVPQGRKVREHLVIELKRPSVPIGPTEAQQIREYALAVAEDDRFDKNAVHWDFYVVSTSLKGTVEQEARQQNQPDGLLATFREGTVRVWARTWGELIEDASFRLKFVRDQLGYDPSTQQAFKYLREAHAQFVPEGIAPAAGGAEDLAEPEAEPGAPDN